MRLFALHTGDGETSASLNIIAEYICGLDSETGTFSRVDGLAVDGWGDCRSEETLLATEEGRRALGAWRAGDDSVHELFEREGLALEELHDELEHAGFGARPDLLERLREYEGDAEGFDKVIAEAREVGAAVLSGSDAK